MKLIQILVAVSLVGLISLIGIIFLGFRVNIQKITFYLISFASGTLLGGALLHLIPEAQQGGANTDYTMIAGGIFIFFILEKFLIWRHCHQHQFPEDHSKPVAARMVLIGDAVHNFIDGVIIASAFTVSTQLGISITLAIILHEIPQELGDFGILVNGGFTMKQALLANALIATTAMAGAVLAYFFLSTPTLIHIYVLPIAAGGLLYIALADLIPQLHDQVALRQGLIQIFLLALGFGIMFVLQPTAH